MAKKQATEWSSEAERALMINGTRLSGVQMLLEEVPGERSVRHRSYPDSNYVVEETPTGMVLRLPVPLVLELYRIGVLAPDPSEVIRVGTAVAAEHFRITDFRYPDSLSHHALVRIVLTRT